MKIGDPVKIKFKGAICDAIVASLEPLTVVLNHGEYVTSPEIVTQESE